MADRTELHGNQGGRHDGDRARDAYALALTVNGQTLTFGGPCLDAAVLTIVQGWLDAVGATPDAQAAVDAATARLKASSDALAATTASTSPA